MLTLESLPAELLYSIHLFSLSPSLPYTSHHLSAIFQHTSITHKAMYLTLRHPRKTLQNAVLYPICSLPVLHAVERIAKTRRKVLSCKELPARLFNVAQLSRPNPLPTAEPVDLPLITHLLTRYQADPSAPYSPDPNSQVEGRAAGYPLARAVLGRHLPLMRLLLAFGADPALMDGEAVMMSIRRGDLEVIRMLLERQGEREEAVSESEEEEEEKLGEGKKRRRRSSGGGGGKRRKMDQPAERTKATSEMIHVAVESRKRAMRRPMVDYLTSRGAIASSATCNLMTGPEWD